MAEATLSYREGEVHLPTGTAYDSGEIIQLADGRAGVIQGLKGVATDEVGVAATEGVFDVASADGVTFTDGEPVFWDISANTAVNYGSADVPNGDFLLGPAIGAKASADLTVKVDLNAKPETAAAAQAAVATTGATNSSPYGFTTAAQADALVSLSNAMRKALIEAGIMKGAA